MLLVFVRRFRLALRAGKWTHFDLVEKCSSNLSMRVIGISPTVKPFVILFLFNCF